MDTIKNTAAMALERARSDIKRLPFLVEYKVLAKYNDECISKLLDMLSQKVAEAIEELESGKTTIENIYHGHVRNKLSDYNDIVDRHKKAMNNLKLGQHPQWGNPNISNYGKRRDVISPMWTPVNSRHNWAPAVCLNAQHYIPTIYYLARNDIKRARKKLRAVVDNSMGHRVDDWISEHNLSHEQKSSITQGLPQECAGQVILAAKDKAAVFTLNMEDEESIDVCEYRLAAETWLPKSIYDKESWTLGDIFRQIQHADHRSALMRHYGFQKLIETSDSEVIEVDSAPNHLDDDKHGDNIRSLIAIKDGDFEYRVVIAEDGSTGRVYYMAASYHTRWAAKDEPLQHCQSLKEWDARVGQPARLHVQA